MNAFDEKLFDLINAQWHTPFLDHFLPAIASTDVWTPILVAIALGAFFWGVGEGGWWYFVWRRDCFWETRSFHIP
jgi:uncharacterized protein (DUF2062 family)